MACTCGVTAGNISVLIIKVFAHCKSSELINQFTLDLRTSLYRYNVNENYFIFNNMLRLNKCKTSQLTRRNI